MEDISRMSNQERIMALGVEEADKYRGPYKRRNDGMLLIPALTPRGAAWHQEQTALRNVAKLMRVPFKKDPIPREFIVPTRSFRKGKSRSSNVE